jgi:hypothetical protein
MIPVNIVCVFAPGSPLAQSNDRPSIGSAGIPVGVFSSPHFAQICSVLANRTASQKIPDKPENLR